MNSCHLGRITILSMSSRGSFTWSGGKDVREVVIPFGFNEIGFCAFLECTQLTNIRIPRSIKKIGDGAFEKCSSLTNIIIPNSVKIIGTNAFDANRLIIRQ